MQIFATSTCPIRSQKFRQEVMNTWGSKTEWRFSIVFMRRSFKGCIRLLTSDSTTVSLESWIIFFNFVALWTLVCIKIKHKILFNKDKLIFMCGYNKYINVHSYMSRMLTLPNASNCPMTWHGHLWYHYPKKQAQKEKMETKARR